MKIIDLLNKIANGEEVPNKIKIGTHIFTKYNYSKGDGTFVSSYESNNDGEYHINDFLYPQYLNDEVEILEEKKIPEKLEIEQDTPNSNYYIRNENGTKCNLTKHSKMIVETLNQVIDYLKSEEEE